jgi:hypothetical protein
MEYTSWSIPLRYVVEYTPWSMQWSNTSGNTACSNTSEYLYLWGYTAWSNTCGVIPWGLYSKVWSIYLMAYCMEYTGYVCREYGASHVWGFPLSLFFFFFAGWSCADCAARARRGLAFRRRRGARARALPAAGPLASPLLQAGEEKPKIGGYSPPSSLGLSVGESPPLIC